MVLPEENISGGSQAETELASYGSAIIPALPGSANLDFQEHKSINQDKENVENNKELNNVNEIRYLQYLRKLNGVWNDAPNLYIAFKDLSYIVNLPIKEERGVPNFFQVGFNGLKNKIRNLAHKQMKQNSKPFNVLAKMSGVIKPATMTLILAPPGHGKSSLLKAIAGRLNGHKQLGGSIYYNGKTNDELYQSGVYVKKLASYTAQTDMHFPILTVKETLDFAAKSAVAPANILNNKELAQLDEKRAEMLINLLGLDECADTILGNDLLRGVSGGQRRRVTIGEMLITNSRVYCMDEISTGLDAAVTFHIFNALQQMTRINHTSIITALLQPTPEVYNLFDEIILMRDGEILYHGPKSQMKSYLKNYLGVELPDGVDEAGFLVDYLTDPITLVRNLERMRMKRHSENNKNNEPQINGGIDKNPENGIHQRQASESVSTVKFHVQNPRETQELHSFDNADESAFYKLPLNKSDKSYDNKLIYPALTTGEMLSRYHSSEYYKFQQTETDAIIHNCKQQEELQLNPSKWSQFTKSQYAKPYPHSFLYHTKLDIVRNAKITFRNKSITIPRLVQAVLMGFIYGTLFYRLAFDDFGSKLGLLMYCAMYGAFANLSELPAAAEARNVVTKQLDAGFYPTMPYILSNVWWSIPRIAVETILFGTLMYWIPDFTPDAGRFFFFLLVLFLASLSLSTFFRTISFVASNPDVARQLDFPFILIMVIFAGFLISYDKIPNWLIWLYYLNPLSWAVTSVSQNEFLSSRYDPIINGERIGDTFLGAFGVTTDEIYRFMTIVYLIGFFVLFTFVSAIALTYVRQTTGLGTKRLVPMSEKLMRKRQSEHQNNESRAVESDEKRQNTNIRLNQEIAVQMQLDGSSKTFNMSSLPFTPVTLAWKNIRYTVYVGKEKKPKLLLRGISGYSKPGSLTALMGSSGAGKTTLMDVIAGRKTVGTIEGDILVNGQKQDLQIFNQISGYVEQNDLHMGLHTVKEALHFSAKMRLPTSVTEKQRTEWIGEVMNLVGLSAIGGRLIGDAAVPGLSPGQLKLLTIGVELVANPSVLFLDEPTSGLDAPSAYRVMKAVRRIADTGRSVLCTIHQPSAELFFMFDRLLLLRSGGETTYFSEIGPQGAILVNYFESVSAGAAPKLPFGMNPANWMLDIIQSGIHTEEGGSITTAGFEARDYAKLWKESDLYKLAEQQTEEATASSAQLGDLIAKIREREYISEFRRGIEVIHRYFTMHWRNAPSNGTRLLLLLTIGVLLGLIYLQISTSDFAGVQSELAVIFLGLAFPASVAASSAFPSFFRQRAVYYRETTIGMYKYYTYSLGMTIVELPYIFCSLFVFLIPYYFLIGLNSDGTVFWKYYLVVYVMAITYSFLSQLWMAIGSTQIVSNILNGFFMSLFFMFGGLFIKASKIPAGWKWFYYIDPIPKALIAAASTQFYCDTTGLNVNTDADKCPVITIPTGTTTEKWFVYDYISSSIEGSAADYWPMIGWLILTIAIIRVLNLIALKYISHIKR